MKSVRAMRPSWIALTAVLCGMVAVGGCGGSEVSSSEDPGASPPRPLPGDGIAVINHPTSRQVKGLPLLGTPPEGLPAEVTRILREPTFGLNWQLAQSIHTRAPGRFWAVPGRGVVCIYAQQSPEAVSSNCAKSRYAVARGLAAILISGGPGSPQASSYRRLMVGIAPAGARMMRIYTDGTIRSVRVSRGAFTLQDEADEPPQKMVPVD